MTTYQLGDGVPLEYRAYIDGVLSDAASVVLTLVNPAGTASTPPPDNDDTGVYTYVVPTSNAATDVGPWLWTWTASGALSDVQTGSFYVSATAPPVYGGLDKLKRRRRIPLDDTTNDDDLLDDLQTSSRMVELKTGRPQFWLSPSATPKVLNWGRSASRWSWGITMLETPDFAVPEVVLEYDSTNGYAAPSWTLIPSTSYEPYRDEEAQETDAYEGILFYRGTCLPFGSRTRLRMTTRWGWPVVPSVVDRASLILASRYGARDASPEGVIQSQEWGGVRVMRYDPDVASLLANLTKPEIA